MKWRSGYPLNESFSIKTTDEGIIICFNDEQPSKASHSIEVILGGIAIFSNE